MGHTGGWAYAPVASGDTPRGTPMRAAGKRSYLVKWKGFTYEECTWEPAKNVTGSARLVQQYKRAAGLNAICHETDDGTRPRHDSETATSTFDTGSEPRAKHAKHAKSAYRPGAKGALIQYYGRAKPAADSTHEPRERARPAGGNTRDTR